MNNERDKMQARFLDREYAKAVVFEETLNAAIHGERYSIQQVRFGEHWDVVIGIDLDVPGPHGSKPRRERRYAYIMCVPKLDVDNYRKLLTCCDQHYDPETLFSRIVLLAGEPDLTDEFEAVRDMLESNNVTVLADEHGTIRSAC